MSESKPYVDDDGRIHMVKDGEHLIAEPASASHGRTALLPTKPSEDATAVLGRIPLPKRQPDSEDQEYLPEEATDWVVTVELDGSPKLDPVTVAAVFDEKWRKKFGSHMSFGRDTATGLWTFLVSADGPKSVNDLKFAFDYIDVLNDDAPLTTAKQYEQRIAAIQDAMKRFGTPKVSASAPPADAQHRSQHLRQLKSELDFLVTIALVAPKGKRFDGRAVWDAMLCLGLQWGDMDCFHWQNESDIGDDSFFSVWTSTEPGYFLPEEVAANRVRVEDLVFGFSVPRSARPVDVFDAMVRAVKYCQKRLGGTIVDEHGPLDDARIRQQISGTVRRLNEAGFQPGEGPTLRLF